MTIYLISKDAEERLHALNILKFHKINFIEFDFYEGSIRCFNKDADLIADILETRNIYTTTEEF